MNDADYIKRALALAAKGRGRTSPNPMVGALVVKQGEILGQGWHHAAGQPHAEIEAIRNARLKTSSLAGSTLYITLEPCCTHGKTPPCTDTIVKEGIRRVVYAVDDPNPNHAGRAVQILKKAGIDVVKGILHEEAAYLNRAFFHWVRTKRPWVILKSAMTLDGKIASQSGDSKWITGPLARRYGMKLRHASDGILVGINTILADDPMLTPRGRGYEKQNGYIRIILDTAGRIPLASKVIQSAGETRTIVVVSETVPSKKKAILRDHVEVVESPLCEGKVDINWLMGELGGVFRMNSLLIEGGGRVLASFIEAGAAQEVAFFYAPIVLGGLNSRKAVSGTGFEEKDRMPRLTRLKMNKLGMDLMLSALIQPGT